MEIFGNRSRTIYTNLHLNLQAQLLLFNLHENIYIKMQFLMENEVSYKKDDVM